MAKFLTTEWLNALTEACNANDEFTGAIASVDLTLQFDTTDAPEGTEASYYLAIADGALEAGAGPYDDPDATITNDYETAVAIAKGETNVQMAFMTGKMKVSGNMAKIMMNQAVFTKFAEAASAVDVEF
ncbi:MAG: SCP2 sterol-binding domain-containing protein [Actinobacteria bacterium]|nr:SCP2 sterol-binding domain-containing protein [Actinomycetota bacterium]